MPHAWIEGWQALVRVSEAFVEGQEVVALGVLSEAIPSRRLHTRSVRRVPLDGSAGKGLWGGGRESGSGGGEGRTALHMGTREATFIQSYPSCMAYGTVPYRTVNRCGRVMAQNDARRLPRVCTVVGK